MVKYYHNIWARNSHTLAPLTTIIFHIVKFEWTNIVQDALEEIKRIVTRDTLLPYPDFNEEFKTHTDARNIQIRSGYQPES